jgi:hypothetical protein
VRRETRDALSLVLFLIAEQAISPRYCACRRPIDSLITPALRAAIDKLEALLSQEPLASRWSYLEVDQDD